MAAGDVCAFASDCKLCCVVPCCVCAPIFYGPFERHRGKVEETTTTTTGTILHRNLAANWAHELPKAIPHWLACVSPALGFYLAAAGAHTTSTCTNADCHTGEHTGFSGGCSGGSWQWRRSL